jgi:hypothetical protein
VKKRIAPQEQNPVVTIEAVTDEQLATISGGRYYGWRNGGWSTYGSSGGSGFSSWSSQHASYGGGYGGYGGWGGGYGGYWA